MTTSFDTITSNDLEEVHMIAGDDKEFTYTVYDEAGGIVNLTSASAYVSVFRYGDPTYVICTMTGTVISPALGQFSVSFPSSSSISLSGVYQQQVKIIDCLGKTHIPSQGKIVIFPSPSV